MKTEWDYTDLAEAYVKRPPYAEDALDGLLGKAKISKMAHICDVGAGVAHLTIPWLERDFTVTAVEPNDAMRKLGQQRTAKWTKVKWFEGTGENTGQSNDTFDLVTFGSSFNVCDRQQALREAHRILHPRGWFACMWNHRDLNDPIQIGVEAVIRRFAKNYDYGSRREDQTAVIKASKLFSDPVTIEGKITHRVQFDDWVEAWRSHATLARQVGDKLHQVVDEIAASVAPRKHIDVPYVTRVWLAQRAD